MKTRGFTLVEALVAALIGAFIALVAAEVSRRVVGVNAQSRSTNQTTARGRILVEAFRSDLRLVGLASTGAIAIDNAEPSLAAMMLTTTGGRNAIPAVGGSDNIAATNLGGAILLAGSDAVQLVVPNPATLTRVNDYAAPSASDVPVVNPGLLTGCAYVLVSDLGRSTGAGRTQISGLQGVNANSISLLGTLEFALQPESTVMCARISTYWVDTDNWLHRTDLANGIPTQLGGGQAYVDASAVGVADRVAPGALDLQIAYRVSGEAWGVPVAPGTNPWAFDGVGAAPLAGNAWFEVRMVHAAVLTRALRTGGLTGQNMTVARAFNANPLPPIMVRFGSQPRWLEAVETLTNLEYYDLGAPAGQSPEPY